MNKKPKKSDQPLRFEYRLAGDLDDNPLNWRTHPPEQLEAIKESILHLGWAGALLYNENTGHLIDGHARKKQAGPDAWVPVLIGSWSVEDEHRLLLTYDPMTEMAEADVDVLKLLAEQTTFDTPALRKLSDSLAQLYGTPQPEEGPEEEETHVIKPAHPKTKKGQILRLGPHRLMCGDATNPKDVAKLMSGVRAGLLYTDPPYGVEYTGGWNCRREDVKGDTKGTDIYGDSLPLMAKYAADEAAFYLWHAGGSVDTVMSAAMALRAAGYEIRAQIIWVKNQAQMGSYAQYHHQHEPCYYAFRKGKAPTWVGPNNEVTTWAYDRANKNEYHPTQKPVELAVRAIRNSSNPGDIVMDMFMGGGSTLIAAEQMGRRCFGMELEPGYCDVIAARYRAYLKQKTKG